MQIVEYILGIFEANSYFFLGPNLFYFWFQMKFCANFALELHSFKDKEDILIEKDSRPSTHPT